MQPIIPAPHLTSGVILQSDKIKEIDEKEEEAQKKKDQENPHAVVKKAVCTLTSPSLDAESD